MKGQARKIDHIRVNKRTLTEEETKSVLLLEQAIGLGILVEAHWRHCDAQIANMKPVAS